MTKQTFFGVIILLLTTSQVMGLTQFNDGEIHDVNSVINDDVWVDWEEPGMNTTVNLLAGGAIASEYKLQGYEDSIINVSGGSIWELYAHDSSQVDVSGGSIRDLFANNSSQVDVSGGSIDGMLFLQSILSK